MGPLQTFPLRLRLIMSEMVVNDVLLKTDGHSLTFIRRDGSNAAITLDADGCNELFDFVASLDGAEKRRRAFRVPIVDPTILSIQIQIPDVLVSVTGRDISFNGLYVSVEPGNISELNLNDEVNIILGFRGKTQMHRGIVSRIAADGYAFQFPEFTKSGDIEPPAEFKQLVIELQRLWMYHRAQSVRIN